VVRGQGLKHSVSSMFGSENCKNASDEMKTKEVDMQFKAAQARTLARMLGAHPELLAQLNAVTAKRTQQMQPPNPIESVVGAIAPAAATGTSAPVIR